MWKDLVVFGQSSHIFWVNPSKLNFLWARCPGSRWICLHISSHILLHHFREVSPFSASKLFPQPWTWPIWQVDLLRQRAGPGRELEEILPRHAKVIRARYQELLQDETSHGNGRWLRRACGFGDFLLLRQTHIIGIGPEYRPETQRGWSTRPIYSNQNGFP